MKEKLKQGCHQGTNPGPWAPKAMQLTVPPLLLQSLITLLTDYKNVISTPHTYQLGATPDEGQKLEII